MSDDDDKIVESSLPPTFVLPSDEHNSANLICRSLLPLASLYDITKLCAFISRLTEYEPLKDSSGSIVATPMATVMQTGVSNCIDLSCLLASLLIDFGYDAFVVFGTAPEWIRIKDTSHLTAELVDNQVVIKDESYVQKKCTGPSGMHCWVLVKPGKRGDLDGTYFIESSSGMLYPVGEHCPSPYINIQSKWNDKNCWVNGSTGNLVDSDWKKVLPRDIMPAPLPKDPIISKETFLRRYLPHGRRTLNADKVTIQLFSGDAVDLQQRVVTRMIEYSDSDKVIVKKVTEIFLADDRKDGLICRTRNPLEMTYQETFSTKNSVCERKVVDGELNSVKWHRKARIDGLVERVEDKKESTITENFLDRTDGLEKRVIKFTPGDWMDLASIEEIT